MTWDDLPLPEDKAIEKAHPVLTGRHDLYEEARRLVGARRSKDALVNLVNWLLAEKDEAVQESGILWKTLEEIKYALGSDLRRKAEEALEATQGPLPRGVAFLEEENARLRADRDRYYNVFKLFALSFGVSQQTVDDLLRGYDLVKGLDKP